MKLTAIKKINALLHKMLLLLFKDVFDGATSSVQDILYYLMSVSESLSTKTIM